MKDILKKINIVIKSYIIKIKYKTKSKVILLGNVSLDCENIKFGNNVTIYDNVQLWGKGKITIGDNVAIGRNTIIFSNENIDIGNNTLIAGNCYIIDSDHGLCKNIPIRTQKLISSKINIGEDVWIGAGTQILKGTIISNGCVIGAGSVVTSKIATQTNGIYAGNPAKKISERRNKYDCNKDNA